MAGNSLMPRLVVRALSVRSQRIVMVLFALIVGAAVTCALVAVYFDVSVKMSRELKTYGANFYVGPGQGATLPDEAYQTVFDGIPADMLEGGSPYLYGTARSELEKIVVAGVRFSSLRKLVPYWRTEGAWIGVDFDDRNALIGKTLAGRLGLKLNDTLVLIKNNEKRPFNIKGIIDSGDNSDHMLFVQFEFAQNWLEKPGLMSHALFNLINRHDGVDRLAETLSADHPDWSVRPIRRISAGEGGVLLKIEGLMGLISLVILSLSLVCVNASLAALITERRGEFALQKALGASNRAVVCQVLAETLIIALLASMVGVVIGYVLAQILGQSIFSAAVDLRAPVIPVTVALTVSVALIAAVLPLRRIAKIEPAVTLRGE